MLNKLSLKQKLAFLLLTCWIWIPIGIVYLYCLDFIDYIFADLEGEQNGSKK